MNSPKIVESTTNMLTTQPTVTKVIVLAQMDSLTKSSTAAIRRDMAESVRKDVKVLKKFGLLTVG